MEIDTLILSGGSIKGVSFLGSINYLIDNDIINFDKIKKIYCVSASVIFIISLILLKYDRKLLEEDMINYDFNDILNINDISLKYLIDDYGFVNYNRSHIYIQNIIKKRTRGLGTSLVTTGKFLFASLRLLFSNQKLVINCISNVKVFKVSVCK